MIAMAFRESLPQGTADEFEQLVQGITAWAYLQHDQNGAHTDITANSLTINPPSLTNGVAGTITFQDRTGKKTVFSRNDTGDTIITLNSGQTVLIRNATPAGVIKNLVRLGLISLGASTGPGVEIYDDGVTTPSGPRDWSWQSAADANGPRLVVGDLTGQVSPMGLRYRSSVPAYELMKSTGAIGLTTEQANLGSGFDSSLTGYWDEAYIKRISMQTVANSHAFAGEWTDVAFNAGNFTATPGMTWTVDSGDQSAFAYYLIGHTMTVSFLLQNTSVSGTPGQNLFIAIPGGFTVAGRYVRTAGWAIDNGVAASSLLIDAGTGQSTIALYVNSGGNWSNSTNATYVAGQISFSING